MMKRISLHNSKESLGSPVLLLDNKRVYHNLEMMLNKAQKSKVQFRPHFKTHQSNQVGEWFRELGIKAITVSSLDMADYFFQSGWTDITLAVPVNLADLNRISNLNKKIDLGLLVDSPYSLNVLANKIKDNLKIWIKIDTGYGRCGIRWDDKAEIARMLDLFSRNHHLHLAGILSHYGHSYYENNPASIISVFNDSQKRILIASRFIKDNGYNQIMISIGDTPSCSVIDDYSVIDEIRPGNFIFYDIMQYSHGVCQGIDIAVAVECPVIGKYPHRNQIAIYGGAVHFSKDYVINSTDEKIFGYLSSYENASLGNVTEEAKVVSLSQEHGLVQLTDKLINGINVGDLVRVFPVHSCLTVDLYKYYKLVQNGDMIYKM